MMWDLSLRLFPVKRLAYRSLGLNPQIKGAKPRPSGLRQIFASPRRRVELASSLEFSNLHHSDLKTLMMGLCNFSVQISWNRVRVFKMKLPGIPSTQTFSCAGFP